MQIKSLFEASAAEREQAAYILWDGFREQYPEAWPTLEDAREELEQCLVEGYLAFMAVEDATVLGWVGGRSSYAGNVWELHPLVVAPARQRAGIGRALVNALEQAATAAGGVTLWLGTDDDLGLTSLGGVDVYPDVLSHVQQLRDRGGHPFGFYQRLGFVCVGIMPDANGFGKPDIFMAKRLNGSEVDKDVL